MPLDITIPKDTDLARDLPSVIRETRAAVEGLSGEASTILASSLVPVLLPAGSTPSVAGGTNFKSSSAVTSVTNFLGGFLGKRILIQADNSNLTFIHNSSLINTIDGEDLNLLYGEVVEFVFLDTLSTSVGRWFQISYTISQAKKDQAVYSYISTNVGPVTFTLPSSGEVVVTKTTSDAYPITVEPLPGFTIVWESSFSITSQDETYRFRLSGTNWYRA